MEICFSRLILRSKDPARLYRFLTFIFDIEAEENSDKSISFQIDSTNFQIIQSKDDLTASLDFVLKVVSEKDLDELAKSIEFFYYKESLAVKDLNKNSTHLTFFDPDGRVWSVEVQSDKTYQQKRSTNKNQISPVM